MVEAIAPRRGEVRTRDLRAVLGAAVVSTPFVDIVVVAEEGHPVGARITLTSVSFGWTRRVALECPTCLEPRHLLLARRGRLQCSTCHQRRTRRQTERHLASWNRMGGREEDLLLRLLQPEGRRPEARPTEAVRLVEMLLDGDRARLEVLKQRLAELEERALSA